MGVRPVFFAALAAIFTSLSFAQTFSSSITGTVTDPSGGRVANAAVELKNMATNDVRKFTTPADGTYQFNNLVPGTYQITAAAAGFKTSVRENLGLQADTNATVNVTLELGGTEQKVEVAGSAVLVDTQTANNTATLDQHLISELPNNTRNPLNFVFALAGTTQAPGGQTQRGGSLDQMSTNFGLNGGRTGDEQVLIDGAPSQAVDWGGLLVAPLQDSIQEQQVVINTYDASYQKAGAGIVTLITRGGTNEYHGEVYDYLRNDELDANYWANNKYGTPRGEFKRNQFGGTFGGPLWKSHNLFFFGGYEGLRQPQTQSSGLLTVPTQAQRNGDFSQTFNADGSLAVIYNPFTTAPIPGSNGAFTRQPFAGNMVPQSLWNSVGVKIVNLFPLPNRPGQGPNQINNYYAQGAGNTVNDRFDARVDWAQSSEHRLFVRFSERVRTDILSPCFFCNGADEGNSQADTGFQAVVNDTITPSPKWVINLLVSYGRWRETHTAVGYGKADAASIGLSPSLFQAPLLPTISADQYAGLGNGSFQRYPRYSGTAQVNATKELDRHTLKFGFNFDLQMINNISEAAGSFNFSNALTSCDPGSSGGPCTALNYESSATGNAIASMLLGTASGGGQGINIDPAMSLHTFGTYIQDQWRVNSRLTINAGLRYENQRPATERFNRLVSFDPNAANPISMQVQPLLGRPVKGAFEFASGSNRFAWPSNNHDFAPRIGIAFKITDRLVARVGAGIFFLPPSALISFDGGQFYGYNSSTPYIATTNNGYTPLNLVNNPFPNGINQPQGSSLGPLTLVGDGTSQIWPKAPHPTPYSEQWSFNLQYQLGTHAVVEAGYTGVRGRKLLYGNPNLDADQLNPQYLSLGTQLDQLVNNPFYGIAPSYSYLGSQPQIAYNELLRPFPQYTYLVWTRSLPGAHSQFDALNIKYTHSFANGLSLLATYQWSKAMDNGPEDYFGWATGNQWRDAYHTNLDYNISTHDIPQSFATALLYELPYGKGKRWGGSAPGVVRQVLGNWQLSWVTRIASGVPLGQPFWSYSNQLNNYGFQGPQIADWTGNPVPANRVPDAWINPNAFAQPVSPYVLGNAAQRITQIRERSIRNIDLAIAKNFVLTERFRVQLRGEALNLTNWAQYNLAPFSSYQLCVTCGDFGDLNSTENDPRNIQLGLKVTF